MKEILFHIVVFLQITSFTNAQVETKKECFLVMVGKDASEDGSVMVAHNNDLTGVETSLIDIIPQTANTADTLLFPSGLNIPALQNLADMIMVKIYKGFEEGDAVAINEFGVSIAGGVALGDDRDTTIAKLDTLIKEGLTGGLDTKFLRQAKQQRNV